MDQRGLAHSQSRGVRARKNRGSRSDASALLAEVPRVRESRMLNNIAFALERLDPQRILCDGGQALAAHRQAQIRMNTAFVLGDVQRPEGLAAPPRRARRQERHCEALRGPSARQDSFDQTQIGDLWSTTSMIRIPR